jgi:flagellar basal-body rod modification protein FlgD
MTTPVTGLPAEYSASQAASAASTSASGLDKDDFLQLLVTSLQYQDPTEPMTTSELMQQSTQLSSMEQLQELTTLAGQSFSLQVQGVALDLVGTTVEYLAQNGSRATGVVSSVDFSGTAPMLVIDGTKVGLGDVATVTPASSSPTTPTPTPAEGTD